MGVPGGFAAIAVAQFGRPHSRLLALSGHWVRAFSTYSGRRSPRCGGHTQKLWPSPLELPFLARVNKKPNLNRASMAAHLNWLAAEAAE